MHQFGGTMTAFIFVRPLFIFSFFLLSVGFLTSCDTTKSDLIIGPGTESKEKTGYLHPDDSDQSSKCQINKTKSCPKYLTNPSPNVVHTDVVNNIAELITRPKSSSIILVRGYYSRGDGGGGLFKWISKDRHDGIFCMSPQHEYDVGHFNWWRVKPTGGCWRRYSAKTRNYKNKYKINLKHAGAKGKGVSSVVQDTTALRAAIRLLNSKAHTAEKKALLYIPPVAEDKFYAFTGYSILVKSNIRIYGSLLGDPLTARSHIRHINPEDASIEGYFIPNSPEAPIKYRGGIFRFTNYFSNDNYHADNKNTDINFGARGIRKMPRWPLKDISKGDDFVTIPWSVYQERKFSIDNNLKVGDLVIISSGHYYHQLHGQKIDDLKSPPGNDRRYAYWEINKVKKIDNHRIFLENAIKSKLSWQDITPYEKLRSDIIEKNPKRGMAFFDGYYSDRKYDTIYNPDPATSMPAPRMTVISSSKNRTFYQGPRADLKENRIAEGVEFKRLKLSQAGMDVNDKTYVFSVFQLGGVYKGIFEDLVLESMNGISGNLWAYSTFKNNYLNHFSLKVVNKVLDLGYCSHDNQLLNLKVRDYTEETNAKNKTVFGAPIYITEGSHHNTIQGLDVDVRSIQSDKNQLINISKASRFNSILNSSIKLKNMTPINYVFDDDYHVLPVELRGKISSYGHVIRDLEIVTASGSITLTTD